MAVGQQTDGILDTLQSKVRFRIDTGRGNSHHRMPSLSAILLNLVSLFVALVAMDCADAGSFSFCADP